MVIEFYRDNLLLYGKYKANRLWSTVLVIERAGFEFQKIYEYVTTIEIRTGKIKITTKKDEKIILNPNDIECIIWHDGAFYLDARL